MNEIVWTRRKSRRREKVWDAVVFGLQVDVREDSFGSRWCVRGYLDGLRVYVHDDDYSVRRELEATQALAVGAARRLVTAGVRPDRPARPVDPLDQLAGAFAARKEAR